MTYEAICGSVERLTKKYNERDPFRLCRAMGIKVLYQPMGKHPNAIKGFFMVISRIRTITINSDLPQVIQRIICAHELGHATLHLSTGIYAFHEVALFDQSLELEKDANLFAGELLLDDQEVLEHLNRDVTFFSAASSLHVPIELLDFKFRTMKWKGYKLIELPINAQSNFLRDMEVPENADYQ